MAESWTPNDDYSPSNHNHDTKYAPSGHNHDNAYAAKSHNHDTIYSKLGHNHDERYYTETEVDAKLKTLKDEIIAAGVDMLPVGTIMWFKQSVTLSNKWQVYRPLIGRYPLGATSDIGTTVEAGLPNITGTLFALTKEGFDTSGAFAGGGIENGMDYQSSPTDTIPVTFDASRCSDVYGKSTTVTPPSAKLIPYVKIA